MMVECTNDFYFRLPAWSCEVELVLSKVGLLMTSRSLNPTFPPSGFSSRQSEATAILLAGLRHRCPSFVPFPAQTCALLLRIHISSSRLSL